MGSPILRGPGARKGPKRAKNNQFGGPGESPFFHSFGGPIIMSPPKLWKNRDSPRTPKWVIFAPFWPFPGPGTLKIGLPMICSASCKFPGIFGPDLGRFRAIFGFYPRETCPPNTPKTGPGSPVHNFEGRPRPQKGPDLDPR